MRKKLKVIHIITDKNIGGAGRWLLNFLSYYDRDKFDVKVILPEDSLLAPEVDRLGTERISIKDLKESSYDKESVKKFKEVFLKENPDVVHTHASLAARMGAKEAKVPVIVNTKHCMEDLSIGFIKKQARKSMYKKYTDMIIAVSEAVKDSLIEGGCPPGLVRMIYNGVKPLETRSAEEVKKFRESLGFSETDFIAGMAARLEEIKDYDTFINAAEEVKSRGADIKFVIMGTGSEEERLKALANEKNLSDTLAFAGFVSDMELAMNALDVNALTSKSEAISLSIVEGMTLGLPAVGTKAGGIPEAIEDKVTGELFDVGDSKALADKLIFLRENPEIRKKYSENAKEISLEKFSPGKMCREIEDLYIELYLKKGKEF